MKTPLLTFLLLAATLAAAAGPAPLRRERPRAGRRSAADRYLGPARRPGRRRPGTPVIGQSKLRASGRR